MSKIVEAIKPSAKKLQHVVDILMVELLNDAQLHHEEFDTIMSIDFELFKNQEDKLFVLSLAKEAIDDAKQTVEDLKKLSRAAELLDGIIHGK